MLISIKGFELLVNWNWNYNRLEASELYAHKYIYTLDLFLTFIVHSVSIASMSVLSKSLIRLGL